MDTSPQKYIDRMKEVSTSKQKLLLEILDLTKKQSETIHEDGIEVLEKVIDLKQERIDAINQLDEQFDVYFKRLKHELKVNSMEEIMHSGISGIRELQEIIAGIMRVIKEISVLETTNNQNAKALLNDLSSKVKQVSEGKRINSAYNPGTKQSPSYFFDKKK